MIEDIIDHIQINILVQKRQPLDPTMEDYDSDYMEGVWIKYKDENDGEGVTIEFHCLCHSGFWSIDWSDEKLSLQESDAIEECLNERFDQVFGSGDSMEPEEFRNYYA
tara:strand:+ start:251 stop:574 length:324 start_codon:yes stop_codon:yes gene_type:complete